MTALLTLGPVFGGSPRSAPTFVQGIDQTNTDTLVYDSTPTEGNVLISAQMNFSSATITPPAGWTTLVNALQLGADVRHLWAFWKSAGASEGNSYQFSGATTTRRIAYELTADPSSPIAQSGTNAGGSTSGADASDTDLSVLGGSALLAIIATVSAAASLAFPGTYGNEESSTDNVQGALRGFSIPSAGENCAITFGLSTSFAATLINVRGPLS